MPTTLSFSLNISPLEDFPDPRGPAKPLDICSHNTLFFSLLVPTGILIKQL